MPLSNVPATTFFRMRRARPFAFGISVVKQDDKPLDLTGSTISCHLQRPGGLAVLTTAATIVEPELGLAQVLVQGDDLDFRPGTYDLAISLTSAEDFTSDIVAGEYELEASLGPVPTDSDPVVPAESLTVKLLKQNRITVKVNHHPDSVLLALTEQASASAGDSTAAMGYAQAAQAAAEAAQAAAVAAALAAQLASEDAGGSVAELEAAVAAAAASAATAVTQAGIASVAASAANDSNSDAFNAAVTAGAHAASAAGYSGTASGSATSATAAKVAAEAAAAAAAASAAELGSYDTDPGSAFDLAVATVVATVPHEGESAMQSWLDEQLTNRVSQGSTGSLSGTVFNVLGDDVTINHIRALTQAEYDALGTPDASTLYVILEA